MTAASTGAVAAPNLASMQAAEEAFRRGGNAVDAAVSAQIVVAVTMPHSAGLGGDMLAVISSPGQPVTALNGTGRSPAQWPTCGNGRAGDAVTVPGAVMGWWELHRAYGRLAFTDVVEPALRLAANGFEIDARLAAAASAQRRRVEVVSPDSPIDKLSTGSWWVQHELATVLQELASRGPASFYQGQTASAIAAAVARCGGSLTLADLSAHLADPPGTIPTISVGWAQGRAHVQPPSSQGVLLAMALNWLDRQFGEFGSGQREHVMVELINACFGHRSDCGQGELLLSVDLDIDRERAVHHGGPRAYLHTAAVATADGDGMVVSSLVSVFDEFGAGVWVPEAGLFLNNRAQGFTHGANSPAPASLPIHTLAPMLWQAPDGSVLALATPGADGQVQTLLQVVCRLRQGLDLTSALGHPRWRSEDAKLLTEIGHPGLDDLVRAGHDVVPTASGSDVFGAVAAAGVAADGMPFAAADHRRSMVASTAGSNGRAPDVPSPIEPDYPPSQDF